jgi:hypothetical protein
LEVGFDVRQVWGPVHATGWVGVFQADVVHVVAFLVVGCKFEELP